MDSKITATSWALLGLLGLTWGGTFMVIEIALRGITPFWVAAARVGFAALLLVAVWRWRGGGLFKGRAQARDWAMVAFIGIFSTAVPFMLLSWGQVRVTSGFAGVSMATVVLMILPLAAWRVPGEALSWRKVVGLGVGFAGVALLIGPSAFASSGQAGEMAGRLACLGAAACYAVTVVETQRLPPVDPIGLAAVQLAFGAAAVIPLALVVEGVPVMPDGVTFAALVTLGLLPTAAATLLRVVLIRSAGSGFMGLVNYIVPVVSVVLGALVLGEAVPSSFAAALALILAGMALSQWGVLRRVFS